MPAPIKNAVKASYARTISRSIEKAKLSKPKSATAAGARILRTKLPASNQQPGAAVLRDQVDSHPAPAAATTSKSASTSSRVQKGSSRSAVDASKVQEADEPYIKAAKLGDFLNADGTLKSGFLIFLDRIIAGRYQPIRGKASKINLMLQGGADQGLLPDNYGNITFASDAWKTAKAIANRIKATGGIGYLVLQSH